MEIFKDFCSSIWGSKNKRRIYNKTIRFKVRCDLLETDIGKIFDAWSEIDYVGYKAMTNDLDWCSLIRQKINNLYTRYFDEEVILTKDYMDLLKTPYNLYYRWIKGVEMDADELTEIINDSIYKASELKVLYQQQKMKKSWEEYKLIIEGYLKRIFDNCKPIEDYELENLTNKYIYELSNEDNSYVCCFCSSLESYMLNYQKEYYNLKRGRNKKYKRCKDCGCLFEDKSKTKPINYCENCIGRRRKKSYIKYNKKRKKK